VDITDNGGVISWRKLVLSIQHARDVSMEDQHRSLLPLILETLAAAVEVKVAW